VLKSFKIPNRSSYCKSLKSSVVTAKFPQTFYFSIVEYVQKLEGFHFTQAA
jgi:hypothetical protein